MLKKIFSYIVVFAVVTLLFSLVPVVYTWGRTFIMWIISWGQWGIIALITLIALAILRFFEK